MHIAKWVSTMTDFNSLRIDGFLNNWEASLLCVSSKVRKRVLWASPDEGILMLKKTRADRYWRCYVIVRGWRWL